MDVLAGFLSFFLPGALLVGAVLLVVQRAGPGATLDRPRPGAATTARRLYVYLAAFVGLLATLAAVSGLLALLVARLTLATSSLLGGDVLRQQASFYLAALVVGAPVWLGHWAWAQRLAARLPGEREAYQRRLFLAAVFAVAGVVALFGLEGALRFVLTLPGGANAQSTVLDGIQAGARLLVFGAAWWAYARVAATPSTSPAERDQDLPGDAARYVVVGFALAVLAFGAYAAVRELTIQALGLFTTARPALLTTPGDRPWAVWGGVAAQLLAGGGVWIGAWRYDLARRGRLLRVVYLYLVLLVAVPVTLGGAIDGLYELARRLFGYRTPYGGAWDFLRDVLPLVVVGAVTWAYHWSVLRRPVAAPTATGAEAAAGAIPWPRRPAYFFLAFLGLAGAAAGAGAIIWVGLDAAVNGAATLSSADWWRDRLSLGLAATLVGAVAWLVPWSVAQRAATSAPARERPAQARRLYLGAVVLVAALAAFGFLVAVIWLLAQAALGEPIGAPGLSQVLKDAATAIVAGGLAAAHAALFRRDARQSGAARRPIHLVTLLTPQATPTLEALRTRANLEIDLVGELEADGLAPQLDRAALERRLTALEAAGESDHALLILHPQGGSLYPYRRIGGKEERQSLA